MGYRRDPNITRITLPSNPAYWVDLREFITYGEQKSVGNDAMRPGPRGEMEVDNEAVADLTVMKYISNWNLDDENGAFLPVTRENLNLLEDIDANAIATFVQGREQRLADQRKNAIPTSSAS